MKILSSFAIAFLAIITVAHANIWQRDYPCDGSISQGMGYQRGWSNDIESIPDEVRNLPGYDVRMARLVAIYSPGDATEETAIDDYLIHLGQDAQHARVPVGVFMYGVGCDGSVIVVRQSNDYAGANPALGMVPAWAFPFTVAQTTQDSGGDVHTQVLSASGFLAATVDYSASSGSLTMTTYDPPLN